jgi:serine phosphatase RsbU (regulator of sigma subunit)
MFVENLTAMLQQLLNTNFLQAESSKYDYAPDLTEAEVYASFKNAKRIQEAIFGSPEELMKQLESSFIFYQPKDIVSGDFYWSYEICDELFIAVGDCSGHGIGGAFLSILGYTGLKRVVTEKRLTKPSEILNALNSYFHSILIADHNSYIGTMDISICKLNKTNKTVEFAGARNPLYLFRDHELIEIKGDRCSIGDVNKSQEHEFVNHRMKLEKNDIIYLFTDGYRDQLGGPDGKKVMNANFRHLLRTIAVKPMEQQLMILRNFINSWKTDFQQTDDMCIMGYQYL